MDETLVATQPWVYHILAPIGDCKLMIHKTVNHWLAGDYNTIQQ